MGKHRFQTEASQLKVVAWHKYLLPPMQLKALTPSQKERRGTLRAKVTSLQYSYGDPSLTLQRKHPMPPGPDNT